MKKIALILAGAALFDLGTIVVASQAASVDAFLKVEGYKLDSMHTAASCTKVGGTVLNKGADKFCQTPAKGTTALPGGANAATKAPAKKEEAKKE
jgi:hypothetical protein